IAIILEFFAALITFQQSFTRDWILESSFVIKDFRDRID
ncbi:hypothetical protein X798_04501, partial [Onchocerca flexuosa]